MEKAEKLGKKLLLPVDTTIAKEFPNPIDAEIEVSVVPSNEIPADMMGLDIGTKTAELYAEAVKSAKTVVWNGPMGVFENPILAKGTIAVAKSLACLLYTSCGRPVPFSRETKRETAISAPEVVSA